MDVKPIIAKGGVFLCTGKRARINPQGTCAWRLHHTSRTLVTSATSSWKIHRQNTTGHLGFRSTTKPSHLKPS